MTDEHVVQCPKCGGVVLLMGAVKDWLEFQCYRCRLDIRIRQHQE